MKHGFSPLHLLAPLLSACLLGLTLPAAAQPDADDTAGAEPVPPGYEYTAYPDPYEAPDEFDGLDTVNSVNPDPWEGLNRKIFAFNEFADRWVLKPVATGYRRITPNRVEQGIGNVFSNLGELTVMLNNLLQGKVVDAASDGGRFLINSTLGVVGIFDVASQLGMEKNSEDFGQTLGYWGVGSGPYVVLPLLGPRTVRDGLGSIPDAYSNPITYIDHTRTQYSVVAVGAVSLRAKLLEAEKMVQGDRYIFLRDAYLQRRQFLVNDGVVENDDFGDEDFDDDW